MLTISTLDSLQLEEITTAFNRAFADYIVSVRLTPALLLQKMQLENIRLAYSTGAFADGELVGLMLHGVGKWNGQAAAYNGGTGIIPEYRGRRLVKDMYGQLLPALEKADIRTIVLEVIDTNERAIRAYRRVGFEEVREVDCFKGRAGALLSKTTPDVPGTVKVRSRKSLPWEALPAFWNFQPTWQNGLAALRRGAGILAYLSLEKGQELVAYGAVAPDTGRVPQFAVHPQYRRQGLGRLLFHHLRQQSKMPLSILNISREDEGTRLFLEKIGFEKYLGQYEMCWKL